MFSSFISQFLNSCMCVHVDYCNSCVCMHYGEENIVCTSPASQYSNVVLIVLYLCFQLLIVCPVCTVWGWQECCFILLISSVCLVVDIILFSVDPNILHTYSLTFLKIFFITSPDAECIMRFIACLWSGVYCLLSSQGLCLLLQPLHHLSLPLVGQIGTDLFATLNMVGIEPVNLQGGTVACML